MENEIHGWVVMKIIQRLDLDGVYPIKAVLDLNTEKNNIIGFIPVFESKEKALEYADGTAEVFEIKSKETKY